VKRLIKTLLLYHLSFLHALMKLKDIDTNKYGRQGHFLFLIGYCLKKSSHLKLLGKMEPILAGSIYVRSSIKLLH
jgi:hypothetical protein